MTQRPISTTIIESTLGDYPAEDDVALLTIRCPPR
jgi:hypothetical protein